VPGWTREAIATRVEALAREHEGAAFVDAVERFSRDALDARERQLLHDVLLARSPRRGRLGARFRWHVRDVFRRFELRRFRRRR
jgi:hypothetical protein